MKNRDIRAANKDDLIKKTIELRKELIKLRMQIATGTTLKNPGQVKKLKKTIARILTRLNAEKETKEREEKEEIKNRRRG